MAASGFNLDHTGLSARRDWPSLFTGLPAVVIVGVCCGSPLLWIVGALFFASAAVLMPSLSYAYGWSQVTRMLRVFLTDHLGIDFVQRFGLTFVPAGPADT